MAMTAPVYPILATDPSVTGLVPASRIHAQGFAGDKPVAPYITWQLTSAVPGNYVADRPGIDAFRAKVDCWAESAAQAQQVAEAVRDALELHANCASAFEDYDPETKLYRYSSDWRFQSPR